MFEFTQQLNAQKSDWALASALYIVSLRIVDADNYIGNRRYVKYLYAKRKLRDLEL